MGVARSKNSIQLTVPKPVAVPGAYGGKPVEMQMAAAILQKGHVGFYFMGVYMNGDAKKKISPALMEFFKSKACFHLKTMDDALRKDIETALDFGAKVYKERGWI